MWNSGSSSESSKESLCDPAILLLGIRINLKTELNKYVYVTVHSAATPMGRKWKHNYRLMSGWRKYRQTKWNIQLWKTMKFWYMAITWDWKCYTSKITRYKRSNIIQFYLNAVSTMVRLIVIERRLVVWGTMGRGKWEVIYLLNEYSFCEEWWNSYKYIVVTVVCECNRMPLNGHLKVIKSYCIHIYLITINYHC